METATARNGSMVPLAVAAGALDLVGARLARRHGLAGEPFRLTAPSALPPAAELAGWGTALSAPWLVDVGLAALAVAADRGRPGARRSIRNLGWLRLVGVLAEPATWGRRHPRWVVLVSAGHVALAATSIRSVRAPASRTSRG